MFDKTIQDILSKHLQPLPAIIMEQNLARDIDDVVGLHLPKMCVAVVDDVNTSNALGDKVARALKNKYEASHITLSRGVVADDEAIEYVEEKTKNVDALVAVGSGTINDICKYVSHKAGKPYIIFPTAASMNGYVSATSSLNIAGKKQSHTAQLPTAVIVDLSVVAAAPTRLSQAGLGDSLARLTAQADLLLAHHLLGTEYNEIPFQLTTPYEEHVFAEARGVAARDISALTALFKLLLLSGFGMTIAKSSAPASQGEHMIAHAYNMLPNESQKLPPLHGEEIALTTQTMAQLQQKLLRARPQCAPTRFDFAEMKALYGEENAMYFETIYLKKSEAINAQFPDRKIPNTAWTRAQEAIMAIHLSPEKIATIAAAAGLPQKPEMLGWNENDYNAVLKTARFTRDRLTFLDLF